MEWVRRALALALFAGVLIVGWRFAALNSTSVAVHYLAGEVEAVLWQVLLAAFALGLVLPSAVLLYLVVKNRLVTRRYRKALGGLEAEIHQLRNLPLAPETPAPGASEAAAVPPPSEALGRGA